MTTPASIATVAAQRLRWQALVDWPGDGIWGATDVDISNDLVGLVWRWGRTGLPVPEFARPATLELTLRNRGHRYTPDNAASALAGLVQSGRDVWFRAAWAWDQFATNGDVAHDLDGRQPDQAPSSWQVWATSGNGFEAEQGIVRGVIAGGRPADAVAVLDTSYPTATLLVKFRRQSNGLGGFVLRCAALNDCLRLRFTDDSTLLERVSGRSVDELAIGNALNGSQWYEIEIVQSDTSVQVYATNLEAAGTVRQALLSAGDLAGIPDSGRHGLWHGFRNATDRWGEFRVGRSLFCGRISSIEPDHRSGRCRITAVDYAGRLENIRLFRSLSAGLKRSGAVAAAILGRAGVNPSEYAVDTGRLLLTGGPRSVWNVTAGQALRRLQREEHGLVYADGLGRIRLESAATRSAIQSSADPVALAGIAVVDTALETGPYASGLAWLDGAADVEQQVTFRYERPVDNGRQLVWSLGEALEIPAGGSQQVLAATDEWDAVTDIETPATDTDYTATDDEAGGGTDVTSDVRVAVLTEAESGLAGRGAVLKISNSGSQAAWVQSLNLYAAHCWSPGPATAYQRGADGASGSAPRSRIVGCHYIDHYSAARQAADARYAERSRRRAQLELCIPLASAANLRAVAESWISQVVEVRADTQGTSGAWFLEGMELRGQVGTLAEARWWLAEV